MFFFFCLLFPHVKPLVTLNFSAYTAGFKLLTGVVKETALATHKVG